jgi:sugar (pentulose or hexulose) kinase
MAIVLGLDVGTTTITCLALDTASGSVLAVETAQNDAEITSSADKARGRSEWDARRITERACECLRGVAQRINRSPAELAGIGITGQQHGVVLVDELLVPLTPLINWQDRRTTEIIPGTDRTFVSRAVELLGDDAPQRAGCRMAAGYMGATLFWMKAGGTLPKSATACFMMDYVAAMLTGARPVSEPTSAASSGLLDVQTNQWDAASLDALGLPAEMFPEVRAAGQNAGTLTRDAAEATSLPQGLPVFVAIGDNQASFLGTVADRDNSVLVNVGTGGQVAAYTDRFIYAPPLETRPFPMGGYLLANAGLCGGRSYAVLENFFRLVGRQMFGVDAQQPLYTVMNQLAASVAAGADGLSCEPLTRLVGTGNGLRENAVLASCVEHQFSLPLLLPRHREEAALGAALTAAVGSQLFPDLADAGRSLVKYENHFEP